MPVIDLIPPLIIATSSFIVAISTIIITIQRDAKMKLIDNFNRAYNKTFSLRDNISKSTQKLYGNDFYYELDTILGNEEIQESVLDYLTEMNNFFNYSMKYLAKCRLKKLMSIAFYQRIVYFYPYILVKRNHNNPHIFEDYVKALLNIQKMKVIKNQRVSHVNSQANKYYIGIRESDTKYSKDCFKDNICFFSSNAINKKFITRHNQNIYHHEILPLMVNEAKNLLKSSNKCKFVFYNQESAYYYPKEVQSNTLYLNDSSILELINNKLSLKKLFERYKIPIIPYETFSGNELDWSKISSHFISSDKFVIQATHGSGGVGTFIVDKASFDDIISRLEPVGQYIVSPYINNSISVNTHIFISQKQTILSPGSVQIIEIYQNQLTFKGSDFITFRELNKSIRDEIKLMSLKIANIMHEYNYIGVAGLDFIINEDGCIFCSEINPRFQASTILIDKYLKDKQRKWHEVSRANKSTIIIGKYFKNKNVDPNKFEAKSVFQLNEMAFDGCMISTLCFDDEINLSCYNYYNDALPVEYFKNKIKLFKKNKVTVLKDGLDYYLDRNNFNENSYMFRAIFTHAICGISPDMTLWINNNIKIEPKPDDTLSLKIALLNQGIRIDKNKYKSIKSGVYKSVDISIVSYNDINNLKVNCAYEINLSKYSPYYIKKEKSTEILYYYSEPICNVIVELDKLIRLSKLERNILYLATDRLKINHIYGCENKNAGNGCVFCDIPMSNRQYSLDEIKSALQSLKKINDIQFRHILIGGGSNLKLDGWDMIVNISNYLKSDNYYNKPISLMSMIPPILKLQELKNAGVEEVAFNIEIADEELARKLMPNKGGFGKSTYYHTFKKAVEVFGEGNVRSILLVGIDKENDIYNEIITLANMGVLPCLSALRCLPNTKFENKIGPDNRYLREIYDECIKRLLLSKKIKRLGPDCRDCQNNILII